MRKFILLFTALIFDWIYPSSPLYGKKKSIVSDALSSFTFSLCELHDIRKHVVASRTTVRIDIMMEFLMIV